VRAGGHAPRCPARIGNRDMNDTPTLMQPEDFDALDAILDDLRTRDE
jgi:hypothetical protein